ncbi:MAG: ABC transporter permease [Chloroflexi bacterium]|nr:ABC transporter permease [Chloroflexota bacterium]
MVSLARANLLHEKSKIGISIAGVVLGVFLIFATTGLYLGITSVVENMTLKAGADLWVTAEGSSGSLHSPSLIPLSLKDKLKNIAGVREVTPLIRRPVATDMNGEQMLINVNGYDIASGLAGPWKVIAGTGTPGPGEVVVDRVLAKKDGLEIGRYLALEGREFKVVGISDETFTMISYLVFMPLEDARTFMPPGLTNFFLLKIDPTSDIDSVSEAIRKEIPAISVARSETNAAAAKEETVGGFLPIVLVISAIGVLVSVLVVGLLVYTMTIEKSREYGIVRAIGANNFYLYRMTLFQAMTISIVGYIIGAIISPQLVNLIRYFVPEFIIVITPQMALWVFLVFLATGFIASFIPVRRLSRIDPAVVFKGS